MFHKCYIELFLCLNFIKLSAYLNYFILTAKPTLTALTNPLCTAGVTRNSPRVLTYQTRGLVIHLGRHLIFTREQHNNHETRVLYSSTNILSSL